MRWISQLSVFQGTPRDNRPVTSLTCAISGGAPRQQIVGGVFGSSATDLHQVSPCRHAILCCRTRALHPHPPVIYRNYTGNFRGARPVIFYKLFEEFYTLLHSVTKCIRTIHTLINASHNVLVKYNIKNRLFSVIYKCFPDANVQ